MFPSGYHIHTSTLSSNGKLGFEHLWLNTLRWVVGHFKIEWLLSFILCHVIRIELWTLPLGFIGNLALFWQIQCCWEVPFAQCRELVW